MIDPQNPHYGEAGAVYGAVYYSAGAPVNPKPKKMSEIKQSLSKLNPTQLIALAATQAALMAPVAPATPPIPNMATRIAALTAKHDAAKAANDAYEAAKAQLAALKTDRDNTADELRAEFPLVASAAQTESGGDGAMLQAAGYALANGAPTPAPPLGQALNLVATMGDADGSLDLACDALPGARTYEWQVTTADPVNGPYLTIEPTTASKTTVTGRASGSRVWVRVRGVGPKGPGPWSDPATKIVP